MGEVCVYVTVSVASVALASFFTYDGESRKASRLALGIILLASLVSPIASAVRGLASIDFSDTGAYVESSAVEKTLEEAFCEGVAVCIAEEFSLKADTVSVKAHAFNSETMRADELTVTLSGSSATKDLKAVENFVNGLGLGKCILEVRLG